MFVSGVRASSYRSEPYERPSRQRLLQRQQGSRAPRITTVPPRGIMDFSQRIEPRRASELLRSWFVARDTDAVEFREVFEPEVDPDGSYRVAYEASFTPRALDRARAEVWVSDDGFADSLADAPTLHHRIDQMNRTESPIPLRRLSAEESEGIPEEERFELRGDEGEVVETSLLMLNHLDAEVSHEVVSSACAEFGLPGTRWTLVARVAPGMDDDGKRLSTDG